MDPRRENRVLRAIVILLAGVLFAQVPASGGQTQRFPGPGTGVVDVNLVNDARVNAAQHGEWRVAQQGEWKVGVQGSVATLPAMPPLLRAGQKYEIRWPGRDPEIHTVTELHPSGWARTGSRWVNLNTAVSIDPR